jgi:hypothetical protein
VPRPGEDLASDEEPLNSGEDTPEFFRDHMDEHGE